MLAGLLGWPQATFASKLELAKGEAAVRVTREVDGGLEVGPGEEGGGRAEGGKGLWAAGGRGLWA